MNQESREMRFFSNKIDTLLFLKNKLTISFVLELYSFSVSEFQKNPDCIFGNISSLYNDAIIVRSAASTEDQHSTNAGHFSSVLNVDSQNRDSVYNAISIVINSYKKDNLSDTELIFVQKQVRNVVFAGVALSYEPVGRKPYFLINYDDNGSTDSVTNGTCKKCMYIARDYNLASNVIASKLCLALLEVEKYCDDDNLNIEFAITQNCEICIFQVRHLRINSYTANNYEILSRKNKIRNDYSLRPLLLSDMAFWNPSEMIGDNPHPLDYSLYEYLVTDNAWNIGIAKMGYFSTNDSLMVKLGNKPFIKLQTGFSALTPQALNDTIREKLTKYYRNILLINKNLHDKIEFEICFTCFDFSTAKKLNKLNDYGFSVDEILAISDTLFQLTNKIIEGYHVALRHDKEKIEVLESKLEELNKSDVSTIEAVVTSLSLILSAIRDNGIVPFARQARSAFIARAFCLSAVESGRITPKQADLFMRSISTIASEMQIDVQRCKNKEMTKEKVIEKYGHLRSNTYDILSPTYKHLGFDEVFGSIGANNLPQYNMQEISNFNLKFPNTEIEVTQFIKDSIANREYFKFLFTKALSYALGLIEVFAQTLDITCLEASYLQIRDILNCNGLQAKQNLLNIIYNNKHNYTINSSMLLPSVISCPNDFDVIRMDEGSPNFVTNKIVEGETIVIEKIDMKTPDVSGKIVVLQYADPGFDWIFTKGTIAGLVTKYGGMASHMAIRCMEFGIPAAIGCGELIYNNIRMSNRVGIDCLAKVVKPL